MKLGHSTISLAALATGLAATSTAAQQVIVLSPPPKEQPLQVDVGGTDSVTVEQGVRAFGSINWIRESTDLRITNSGEIATAAPALAAIEASGDNNIRSITLINDTGALMSSNGDAFHIGVAPTGGTIRVENYGRIFGRQQALDFDAVSGGTTIIINNHAGALLESFGPPIVHPGEGAILTNAGTIRSQEAPAISNYDAVDFLARSGTVINEATGTITGVRGGIAGTANIDVTNYGLIQGRYGRGVSAGTGTVTNYGSIIAASNEHTRVGGLPEADGVHFDGAGTVSNFGTIRGARFSRDGNMQGVEMTGGLIENAQGGTIEGLDTGVWIYEPAPLSGYNRTAVTIVNAGRIEGSLGISLSGNVGDTVTNSGLIKGAGNALTMGGGDDTLNVLVGGTFQGRVIGGLGFDTVNLSGSGNGSIANMFDFEQLNVTGGDWTLGETALFAKTSIGTGAGLTGTTDMLTVAIANSGTLTFDQATPGTVTAAITGAGTVVKGGTGNVTMGAQRYTGSTVVNGGTLTLAGLFASRDFTVASGATLTSAMEATLIETGGLRLNNSGTVSNTNANGRAIDFSGTSNTRNIISITNNVGGTINSADDAVRIVVSPPGSTIVINNAGTIQTTNGGQALDFNSVASNAASITINNLSTGVLKSFGQDGIRPGLGAVINNDGLIFSDGPINNSFDGIDWQARSGTVNNGGTISGLRHGITSDVAVNVTNSGEILGRNGSGVGSDGTGTVINSGAITGQWDGQSANGDGDGVDIDGIGSVTNSGTIQGLSAAGVDSGGRPNSAEGIAMGGGTIANAAGGTVFGAGNAILINDDTNAGGVADGATIIINDGTIRAGTGYAVALFGTFNDTVTNSGKITGGIAGAIDMADGDDTLVLLTGSVITGTVNLGAGDDQLRLQNAVLEGRVEGGAGTDTVAVTTSGERSVQALLGGFEQLRTEGSGSLTLIGGAFQFDRVDAATDLRIAADAVLTAPQVAFGARDDRFTIAGGFNGSVAGGAGSDTLTVSGGTAASPVRFASIGEFEVFAMTGGFAVLSGQAQLGALTMTGGRFTGLAGSTLTATAIAVGPGATFGSAGTVNAGLTIASGAVFSPGASPAVMTVNGNVSLAGGSTTLFEFVPAPGQSDQLLINGNLTIAAGAVLNLTGNRPLTPGVAYDMIVANSITGQFTIGTWDHNAVQGFLRYLDAASQDRLQLLGTFVSLDPLPGPAGAALTYVNDLLVSGGASSALLDSVNLLLDSNGYASAQAFSLLTPEAYASAMHLGSENGLVIAKAGRSGVMDGAGERPAMFTFGTGTGAWRTLDAVTATEASGAKNSVYELLGGIGYGNAQASLSGFVGYLEGEQRISALGARTEADGMVAGVSGHAALGGLQLYALVSYDWSSANTSRAVPGAATVSSDYDLNSLVLDAVASYDAPFGQGLMITPAVGVTHIATDRDAARESGSGAFALDIDGDSHSATFIDGAIALRGPATSSIRPWAEIGVRHQLAGELPLASAGFVGTAARFVVPGVSRKQTVIAYGIGFEASVAKTVSLFAGYRGESGDGSGSNLTGGVRAQF